MQSSLVTCVSKEGWPSRRMHACDRDGAMEELVRWPETHLPFHENGAWCPISLHSTQGSWRV